MTDDFSDAPVSIAELRANRSQKAKDWSPRDVLVDLLRDIDRGKLKPLRVAVVLCCDEGNENESTVVRQGGELTFYAALGMLQMGQVVLMKGY